jgi:hypothetical protein
MSGILEIQRRRDINNNHENDEQRHKPATHRECRGRLKTVKWQDKDLNECLVQQQEPKREELNFESDGIAVKVNNYDFYQH